MESYEILEQKNAEEGQESVWDNPKLERSTSREREQRDRGNRRL